MTSITITPDDKKAGFTLRELSAAVHHLVASGFNPDTSRITATTTVRNRVTSLTAKTINDPAPPHVEGSIKAEPTTWVLAPDFTTAHAALEQRGISHSVAIGRDAYGVKIRTTDRSLRGAVIRPGDRLLALGASDDVVKSFELALLGSRRADGQPCGYADLEVLS